MTTHPPTSTHSLASAKKATRVVAILMAAFALLLTLAPGVNAQELRGDTQVIAATSDCPDGFELGRFGCQPTNLTTDQGGRLILEANLAEFDNGCPDRWVPSSAPGGCSPGYLTLKLAGIRGTIGCPDTWVPSSAPGGCSPGFLTSRPAPGIYASVHGCAFGSACNDMIEAVKALGGECNTRGDDTTCTLPTGPDGRG